MSKKSTIINLDQVIRSQREEIDRLISQSAEKDTCIATLSTKLAQAEAMLKERTQALRSRDLQASKQVQKEEELTSRIEGLLRHIQNLEYVVAEQQREFEEESVANEQRIESLIAAQESAGRTHKLNREFAGELLEQVEEVETTNAVLMEAMEGYHMELRMQNEQASDLLGDVEFMMERTST